MIVLDEHLQGVRLEETIAQWYRGRVCFISSLRPGSVIKDESIPHLLRSERQPTFVTQNWKHFWHRTAAHSGFCIVCFVLPSEQVREIAPLRLPDAGGSDGQGRPRQQRACQLLPGE
jgi:hypothetical protein